jgi:uncharacterized phage-associated protein
MLGNDDFPHFCGDSPIFHRRDAMTYSAEVITDALLYQCRLRGLSVGNLMLQKLLYYAQGWSLVLRNKPLFNEEVEAWVHGPVVPSVFRRFKHLKWDAITEETTPRIDTTTLGYLNSVLDVYGKYQPKQLERLTHSERPWCETRIGLAADDPSNRVIPKALMQGYFSSLAGTRG